MTNENDFITWINAEVEHRGWSYSELARRAGISPSNVHLFVTRKRNPTYEFCMGLARAFGESPERVLRRAGLLPLLPAEIEEEYEAISILRRLSGQVRNYAMVILRGLARADGSGRGVAMVHDEGPGYRIQSGDLPHTPAERAAYTLYQEVQALPPEDQQLVFDLMKRLRGLRGAREAGRGTLETDS